MADTELRRTLTLLRALGGPGRVLSELGRQAIF
jgi:hypothetical protein